MSRKRFEWMIVGALALGVGACAGTADEDVGAVHSPIISGSDDRQDVYQLSGQVARNADGVALMAYTSGLTAHDGVVDLPVQSFSSWDTVCSADKFASQPVTSAGHCTAYLIAPQLVATAGHCTNYDPIGTAETQYSFVFGYQMTSATTSRTTVSAADVYTGARVSALCSGGIDCTLVQLDRPVTNHRILQIRRSGSPALTDSVYMIGYPLELPLKYDGPSSIWQITASSIMAQQIDVFAGNSGSPLFNATTNLVEGTVDGRSNSGNIYDLVGSTAGCAVEYTAQPQDNYSGYGAMVSFYATNVPAYCSGDAGGWAACGASGCGVCAAQIDTTKYGLYFQNHPNCTLDSSCTGAFTACSAACPAPTTADQSAATEVVLSRTGWTATASATGGSDVPVNALDGSASTRWSTGAPQANGQWFLLDTKATQTFNQLTFDAGPSTGDYPRGYQVFVSTDGTNFGSAVTTGAGSAALVTVSFPSQTARYVKIVQTGTASSWWSIAELNVYAPTAQPTRINAGGVAVAPYVADVDFTGGTTINHPNTIDLTGVTNPAPAGLYQTARAGAFSYTIPGFAPGSSHTVRLHFAETYFTAAGSRVFNLSLNGSQVLPSFDVFAAAGAKNKAVVRSITAPANSAGAYVITVGAITDSPMVSGIEIQ